MANAWRVAEYIAERYDAERMAGSHGGTIGMKLAYQTNTWGGVVGHPAGVTSVKDLYYLDTWLDGGGAPGHRGNGIYGI